MEQRPAANLAALRSAFGSGPLFPQGEDSRFEVDGVEFVCDYQPDSTAELFYLVKNPDAVPGFLERAEHFRGGTIVELGIAEGGSIALLALAARPRRLVGIDVETERRAALDQFVAERSLSEQVQLHYGVDQSDRDELRRSVSASIGDERLDLVIDDASHQLDLTRASFEVLFPMLRAGGEYVIEDWSADHRFRETMADSIRRDPEAQALLRDALRAKSGATSPAPHRPLCDLAIELVVARASHAQDAIEDVTVGPFEIVVRRGTGDLDPASFRLADLVHDHFGYLSPSERPRREDRGS